MSKPRLKKTITGLAEGRTVKIYWLSETKEYVCRLFVKGVHYRPADSFTNDLSDAYGTAEHMARGPKKGI